MGPDLKLQGYYGTGDLVFGEEVQRRAGIGQVWEGGRGPTAAGAAAAAVVGGISEEAGEGGDMAWMLGEEGGRPKHVPVYVMLPLDTVGREWG